MLFDQGKTESTYGVIVEYSQEKYTKSWQSSFESPRVAPKVGGSFF